MKKYKVVNEKRFITFCITMFVLAVIALSAAWFPVMYWLADLIVANAPH